MSTVANFVLKLSADGTQLSSGLKQAALSLNKFQGLISGAAVVAGARHILDYAGKLADLSAKTGVSTDKLQEWSSAVRLSGGELEDVTASVVRLQKAMVDAAGGGGNFAAFQRLGVSLQDIKSKRPEDLFEQIAERVGQVGINANTTSDVLTVLGKSADRVLPAMANGFADAARAAKDAGNIISAEVIAKLDQAGDQIELMKQRAIVAGSGPLASLVDAANEVARFESANLERAKSFWQTLKSTWNPLAAFRAGRDSFWSNLVSSVGQDEALAAAAGKLRNPVVVPGAVAEAAAAKGGSPRAASGFGGGNAIVSDQLARIGLFRGGTAEAVPILRQVVSEQRRTTAAVVRVAQELETEE